MTDTKLPVPLNAAFKFDGSNSDLAQQLYQRYSKGITMPLLEIAENKLPTRVQERLSKSGASFASLPGILQRALLWDSGYALDYSEKLVVQIWTLSGRSMADIAVSETEYKGPAGCTPSNCTTPTGGSSLRSKLCNGEQMLRVTKCMASDVQNPSLHSVMWALGADPDLTPQIKIQDHSWIDDFTKVSYSVYAIHTEKTTATYDVCPTSGYDAFVIPCFVKTASNATIVDKMAEPQVSTWVDTMIAAFPKSSATSGDSTAGATNNNGGTAGSSTNGGATSNSGSSSGVGAGAIIGIVAGVLVLIGVIAFFVVRKRRNNAGGQSAYHDGGVDPNALITPGAKQDGMSSTSQQAMTTTTTTVGGNQLTTMGRHTEDFGSSSSNSVFRTLLTDPNLADRRLVYEKIEFGKMLSKGAYGEVWICQYEGQDVAVKRLLQNKQLKFDQVRDFSNEIQLSASLQHPNVIGFVGVAWTSLENLVMAVEYLPMGDLQNYLKKNADLLSWARDKIHMALGIARALEYIHTRSPMLIHRDLKSKNVLLTERLDAKLIDFGVSRTFQQEEMTAGVGTPYWTAPEVLEGTKYTERSDIYSFGVLLSELDTCELPYFDTIGPSGEKLKPFQILNDVMAGTLHPSFTAECPPRVRKVAEACFERDPEKRPSASELVKLLEG